MGKLNLLKGAYFGKVGQTVGSKWKNQTTVRTYATPSNPKTDAQMTVRNAFKDLNAFVARFADGIKYLSAWNTAGMSVRNAIVKYNKAFMGSGAFDKETLVISKGGLPKLQGVAASWDSSAGGNISYTWTKPIASNISAEAKAIFVAVDTANDLVEVVEALASTENAAGTMNFPSSAELSVYAYILDKHGSVKVASNSEYVAIA
ncbi:MAG: hypothetical protein ACI4VW_00520 [Acutalibacteraceae bacterium]